MASETKAGGQVAKHSGEECWGGGRAEKPYSVNLWTAHPDSGEDACSTGDSFATLAEARAAYDRAEAHFDEALVAAHGVNRTAYWADSTHVELDGPDVHETRRYRSPAGTKRRTRRDDAADWKHEQAMQAGMAFGCDGFNDEMGWS